MQFSKTVVLFFNIILLSEGYKSNYGGAKSFKEPTQKDGYNAMKQIGQIFDKLENMETKIDNVQKKLQENTEILQQLSEAERPDDEFWNNNVGCGGIISSQTGKITGYKYLPASCVWTINVNHRQWIKMAFKQNPSATTTSRYSYSSYPETPTMYGCSVSELQFQQTKGPGGLQTIKTTNITFDQTYMFKGPIVFLKCLVRTSMRQYVEFEGFGQHIYKDFLFTNKHFEQYNGSFNLTNENLTTDNAQTNKRISYTTITINFPYGERASKVFVQKFFQDQTNSLEMKCKEGNVSLLIYESFNDTSANIYNCCEIDCLRKNFIFMDGIFLATMSSSIGEPNPVGLQWMELKHSAYTSSPCGGIVSGRKSGTITKGTTYDAYLSQYENNQRCVWVIHLLPKTEIQLSLTTYSIEEEHDHLVALEIHEDEPITTKIQPHYTYKSIGIRVLMIFFYSDNTVRGGGFVLKWEATGLTNITLMSDDDQLFRYTLQNGNLEFNTSYSTWSTPPISNTGMILFILNPQALAPNTLSIYQLEKNGSAKLSVYASKGANFTKILGTRDIVQQQNYSSWDGIFIITLENEEEDSDSSLKLSWGPGQSTLPDIHEESCGGVVHGENLIISYKMHLHVSNSERCTWIIHCPYSSVSLTLLKKGTRCCENKLYANVLDPTNGNMLLNTTTVLNSVGNRTTTFPGPIIILSYQSPSNYVTGNGFVLKVTGSGNVIDTENRYRIIHKNEQSDVFSYPLSIDGDALQPNETLIFAISNDNSESTAGLAPKLMLNLKTNYTEVDLFNSEDEKLSIYSYSTVTASLAPLIECSFRRGNMNEECIFQTNSTVTQQHFQSSRNSSGQINDKDFQRSITFYAFVLIYKPTESAVSSLKFDLSWNDESRCGGVIIGSEGILDYHSSDNYANNEHCVWIVETPVANKMLNFELLNSGLEYCCDKVIISSVLLATGQVGYTSYLSLYNSVTTRSPLAIVTFISDHSTTGSGFRIRFYSTNVTPTSETSPQYIFRNLHTREFGHQAIPSIQEPMVANEILTIVFVPTLTSDRESPAKTYIMFQELNLRVNDNCTSDSLRIYNYRTSHYSSSTVYYSIDLLKSFQSFKNADSNCSANTTESTNYDYEEVKTTTCMPECYNEDSLSDTGPRQRILSQAPIIIIYKSVNDQTSTDKGVQFTWRRVSDVINEETETTTTSDIVDTNHTTLYPDYY